MTKQILVCDDDIHIVAAARSKLSSAGYEVITCSDGEEAWEHIENEVPALLISDYAMPRLDGLQLCQRIRDCLRTQHLPVFILTGKCLDQSLLNLVEKFGVIKLITKPFSPRDLVQLVHQAVGIQNAGLAK